MNKNAERYKLCLQCLYDLMNDTDDPQSHEDAMLKIKVLIEKKRSWKNVLLVCRGFYGDVKLCCDCRYVLEHVAFSSDIVMVHNERDTLQTYRI